MEEKTVIGIVAKNSLAYVKSVFEAYENNLVVVLLRSLDDQSRIDITGVTKKNYPIDEFGWFDCKYSFSTSNSLAQISFTSGTEGEPKGVFLTHKALSDVTTRLNTVMEVDSSIREYVGVPAHFSFGLGRFRAISTVGGKAFLPKYGFNTLEIKDMLKAREINAVSTVPTLWRVLLKNQSIFGQEALNLKWIEIGSQFMSRKEKEELKYLFPNAVIIQHYGLTEASRTTFLRIDLKNGDLLDSVGTVLGNTELKISKLGHICIRGDNVASQLLNNQELISNVNELGWLETNDLGEVRDGYLYYQGRADDLINCSGIKLSPDALEQDLYEALNINEGISVSRYPDDLVGNGVLVAKKSSLEIESSLVFKTILAILLNYGINNKNVVKVMQLDFFPVTGTGKVQRKELLELYVSGRHKVFEYTSLASDYTSPSNDFELSLVVAWQKVLKLDRVGITDNFFNLGGDSLTTVMLVNEMEQASGIKFDIGDIFTNPTIELLVKFSKEGKQAIASSIVPLQEKGHGTPLFCICGINIYQELADSLGTSQPVYGIYVAEEHTFMDALLAGKSKDLSVNYLAKLYAEAILRKQAKGPYQLAGISFGGLLAIETARILKRMGAEVSIVVLLDTILPSGIQRSFVKKLKKELRKYFSYFEKKFIAKKNKSHEHTRMAKLREQAYRNAMESFDMAGEYYDGEVVLIKAKIQYWGKGVTLKNDYGWGDVISGDIKLHDIEGDHLGIIKSPNVQSLAKQLKAYLKS